MPPPPPPFIAPSRSATADPDAHLTPTTTSVYLDIHSPRSTTMFISAAAAAAAADDPTMGVHRFKVKTYSTPTFCDECHKLLWGLVRQGVCCQKCHTNAHFKCAEAAAACSGSVGGKPSSSRSSRRSLSRGPSRSNSAVFSPDQHPELPPSSAVTDERVALLNATDNSPSSATQQEQLMARALASTIPAETITTIAKVQQRQAETGSTSAVAKTTASARNSQQDDAAAAGKKGWRSMVDDIIVSTSKHAARMEIKPREPSLNLLTTTPKNMTRFVSRTGGAHAFEITVKDVLSWRNKTLTLLVLAVFTLACLYPVTLVVAPQFLIAYHMAVSYYDHTKAKARREAEGKAPKQPKPVDMDPAPKLKPAEYRDNLQFIQNSMGMFCDAYDTVVLFQRQYLNWDYPENALTFLKVVVSSVVPSLALFVYVPLNHLVLVVGWLVFIANTPLAIAMSETLTPVLLEILNENWEFAKGIAKKWPEVMKIKPRRGRRNPDGSKASGAGSGSELGVPEEGLYMVAIYENQRWWLGLGFINYLLTSERPAWSDYSGTIPLPPRSSYAPPPGFDFLDADWQVDRQWSVATPDVDGWVYSDHLWGNPRSAAGVGSLTRRRKWVRRVVRRVDPLEAAAAARAAAATASVVGSPAVSSMSSVLPTPPESATSPASSLVVPAADQAEAATKPRSGSVSSNTTLFRGGPQEAAAGGESASVSRSGSNESVNAASQGPTVSTSAGLSSVPIKATDVAGMLVNEDDGSLVTVIKEVEQEVEEGGEEERDEIEYILELDGEEIVLEGVKSLDMVDMDRLREMVRAIKRESRMSARSSGSGKVRKIRVE